MPCPEATGACTVASDGDCIAPKSYNPSLVPLTDVYIVGADDAFTITWNTDTPYVGERVRMWYRIDNTIGYPNVRKEATRDSGTISSDTGQIKGDQYVVWLRPETETEYGDWHIFMAITDAGWNSNSEVVLYNGETLFYGTDVVLYS